jgi:poly(A) polymerase
VLYLSLADYLAARGPMLETKDWLQRVDLVNYVIAENSRESAESTAEKRRPLLTGHDLIEVFELEPGPIFRRLLDGLEEARAASEISSKEEALVWVRTRLEDGTW